MMDRHHTMSINQVLTSYDVCLWVIDIIWCLYIFYMRFAAAVCFINTRLLQTSNVLHSHSSKGRAFSYKRRDAGSTPAANMGLYGHGDCPLKQKQYGLSSFSLSLSIHTHTHTLIYEYISIYLVYIVYIVFFFSIFLFFSCFIVIIYYNYSGLYATAIVPQNKIN